QHGLGGDVGIGEVIFLLALLGNADLVDDRVVAVGIQTGDQAVPLALQELGFDTKPLGNLATYFDVEADELVVRVMEGEGRIGSLRADAEDAGLLDVVEVGPRAARGNREQRKRTCGEKGEYPFHVGNPADKAGVRPARGVECGRSPAAI